LAELGSLGTSSALMASLHLLAKRGQVVYDFATSRYRYRPILLFELSEQVLGPDSPELSAGVALAGSVSLEREEALPLGKRLFVAKVGGTSCEAVLDPDGQLSRARCSCSFFYKSRLRAGPCRHLMALKLHNQGVFGVSKASAQ